MQKKWVVLGLLIVLGALIFSGCAVSYAEEPVVDPDHTPENVVDPKIAREAALNYIRAHCGRSAPPEGIAWAEENLTREGWVGGTTFRYTVETWTVTVSYSIVNPVDTIFQVTVVNETTGFRWEGEVDAAGQVTETPGEPAEWFTPTSASDAALAYVDGRYDTALVDLLWAESDVTSGAPDKPLVGAVKLRYTAGDWTLSLSYPVVRPDLVRYRVTIANEATGFRWQGEVDAAGQVTETSGPHEDTEAAVDGWTGTIGKLPWGSQFGIYFERDDGERFGIHAMGGDAAVNGQIETTRWTGARVQVWGELIEGIPDVNGRQIQVERMEILSGPEDGARDLACLAEASASSVLPSDRWGTYHAWSATDGLVD